MARPKGSKNKPKENNVDVSTQVETQKVGEEPKSNAPPHYRSRLALINEISTTNKERHASENPEEGDFQPLVEEQDESDESEESTEQEENSAEVEVTEQTESPKHKFVLDGKEVEMTDEEVRAHVQKSATADTRMREAAKMIEDARRLTSPTHNPSRSAGLLPDAPSTSDAGRTPDKETVQKLTRALYSGNEEEIAGAVEVLLGGGRQASQVTRDLPTQTQGMTPHQIAAFIDEKLSFENAKKLLDTPKDQGGLQDVYADPMLKEIFHQKDNDLLSQGDQRPYAERYKAIGEDLRKWKDEFVKKNSPPTGLEDRDALKRTTGVVRGAGGKLPAASIQAKPKSQEEIIAGLRKSRGLN